MSKLHDKFLTIRNSLKNDQLPIEEIDNRIIDGVKLKGSPLLILVCSTLVASIGLNINSTTMVIGAKLIAPLLLMLMGVAYGTASSNKDLAKSALYYFCIQFLIILAVSTTYFFISPIKIPTEELISKTTVNFADMLVALIGGACAVIATTRYEKYNVLPGVAIATSLVPPACTIGYGIANLNPSFIVGALYLFVVNVVFITFSIYIVFKIIDTDQIEVKHKEKYGKIYHEHILVIASFALAIPIILSATIGLTTTYQNKLDESNAFNMVKNEFDFKNSSVIREVVDTDNKTITLFVVGDTIDEIPEDKQNELLAEYNLEEYDIILIQGTNDILSEFGKEFSKQTFR